MRATAFFVVLLAATGCATQQPTIPPASYLSGSLGSNMDSSDHVRANDVLESGSEDRPFSWVNPISKKRFTVTPTKTYKRRDSDCRDYTAIYGGRTISGSACRQDNGVWLPR